MGVLEYIHAPLPVEHDTNPLSGAVSSELCSSRYTALYEHDDRRSAHLVSVSIGNVNIVRFENHGVSRCDRRPDHIRDDQSDCFVLCLPLSAYIGMRHGGVETELSPGNFTLISTLRPAQGAMIGLDTRQRYASLFARIPGPLLRQRVADIDACCNQRLEIRPGAGKIMRSLLNAALEEGAALSESESTGLSATLLDMIGSTMQPQIAERRAVNAPRPSSAQKTLERARTYIAANLSNPDLGATQVAAHCRVSVRYLHAVFAPTGITLAGFIRESRLLQCQSALRNGKLQCRSIIEIAGQWGFEDPAHFSRAYKLRFGRTPSDERRQ